MMHVAHRGSDPATAKVEPIMPGEVRRVVTLMTAFLLEFSDRLGADRNETKLQVMIKPKTGKGSRKGIVQTEISLSQMFDEAHRLISRLPEAK